MTLACKRELRVLLVFKKNKKNPWKYIHTTCWNICHCTWNEDTSWQILRQ